MGKKSKEIKRLKRELKEAQHWVNHYKQLWYKAVAIGKPFDLDRPLTDIMLNCEDDYDLS